MNLWRHVLNFSLVHGGGYFGHFTKASPPTHFDSLVQISVTYNPYAFIRASQNLSMLVSEKLLNFSITTAALSIELNLCCFVSEFPLRTRSLDGRFGGVRRECI